MLKKLCAVAVAAMPMVLGQPAMAQDLAAAVAAADPVAGEAAYRVCGTCHTNEQGARHRVGPNLWGVVGKQIGTAEGFRYSRALTGSEEFWTFENLNAFLENPRAARPGTSMSFPGIRDEAQRMNVLSYLNTLQDEVVDAEQDTAAE